MDALATWIKSTQLSNMVVDVAWAWPLLETVHFIALCFLIGALLIMDLRLIGLQSAIPLRAVHSLLPVAIVAFAFSLLTGLGFLFGDPSLYFNNPSFYLKMALVLLAGVNFLFYHFKVEPTLLGLESDASTPALAKAVGIASLALWFGVLTFGRLLPFLGPEGD